MNVPVDATYAVIFSVSVSFQVIRQPYLTDKLKIILKDNSLHCLYLNDWDMAVAAFTLQCPEAKVSKYYGCALLMCTGRPTDRQSEVDESQWVRCEQNHY